MATKGFDQAAPQSDGAQAAQFFSDWFGPEREQLTVVTQIVPDTVEARTNRTHHIHQPPATFEEMFRSANLDELVYANGKQWNLYMGVGLMREKPQGRNAKGGKSSISAVPGVWVDLDVNKEGAFRDEQHALELLRTVRPLPTIVVATGTGGVHGYWRCPFPLTPEDAERLTLRWWCHLSRMADAKIDKLTNCDRIMKLPGSVRWPKDPGDEPALVRLLYSSRSTVAPGKLEQASEAAWGDYQREMERYRAEAARSREKAARALSGVTGWNKLMTLASLEDHFNATHTWPEVLEPLGWTQIGTDGAGRTLWSRPGQTRPSKSAATDFNGSDVMSLFSDSEVTRPLVMLREAGFNLTKYRVYIQSAWNGDEAAYMAHEMGIE